MFRLDLILHPKGLKIKYKGVLYCASLPFLSFLLVHQGPVKCVQKLDQQVGYRRGFKDN